MSWNSRLVLDPALQLVDGARSPHFQLEVKLFVGLDQNLDFRGPKNGASALVDAVVREGTAIVHQNVVEDQTLLMWEASRFFSKLGFHNKNCVRCRHVQCDGLASSGLDNDFHAADGAPQARPQMKPNSTGRRRQRRRPQRQRLQQWW